MSTYTAKVKVTLSNNQVFTDDKPFSTNSLIDFADWLTQSVEHFEGVLKFHYGWRKFEIEAIANGAVSWITIERVSNGEVRVIEHS